MLTALEWFPCLLNFFWDNYSTYKVRISTTNNIDALNKKNQFYIKEKQQPENNKHLYSDITKILWES